MNVALTCVEYKLIPAAFKGCYFSKPNTLNHYSQCCIYLFAVHSFLNSFRDSFWSWSLRCSVENALPGERRRETIPDVPLQVGLLYTTKKAKPIPWPWRNRVQRQSKRSIKVFWRVDWKKTSQLVQFDRSLASSRNQSKSLCLQISGLLTKKPWWDFKIQTTSF